MKSFDTIYRTKKTLSYKNRPTERSWRYFYKSLEIVLSFWIVTLLAVTTQPWLDYWVKSTINDNKQDLSLRGVAGDEAISGQTAATAPGGLAVTNGIFYLKTAKLEIEAPIVEGIEEEDLKKGIGHHPDSVWPNMKGNVVLAGHNFDLDAENPYGKVFISLRLVEIGDEVTIDYQGKTYYYQVFKKETVMPDDTSLFGQTDNFTLTFYTCDPPYTDWKRLVLQAQLIRIE